MMTIKDRMRHVRIRTLRTFALLVYAILLVPSPASAADTIPPSPVADLVAAPDAAEAKITLTWTAATDDVGVAYYVIVRDVTGAPMTEDSGILVPVEPVNAGDDNSGTFVYTRDDYDVIRGETIWYAVFAVDLAGNSAPLSNVAATTPVGETFPHGSYTDLSGLCGTCHKIHQPRSQRMVFRRAPEIEICYTCHDGTGSTYDIRNYAGFEGLAAHEQVLAPPASTNIVCNHCHTPHGATDQDFLVRSTNPEEVLCRNCHQAGNTLSVNNWDIDAQFNKASYHALTGTTSDGLTGAKVECTSCHGPHTAQEGAPGSAPGVRLSDPMNTWKLWQDNGRVAANYNNFCLECHTGASPPLATWNDPVTFVPVSIAFPAVSAPFFAGWDKTPFRDTDSQHFATGVTCQNCHHPHGSDNQRLKAWSYRADNPADPDYSYFDDAAAQAKEENLCYQCHDPTPPADFLTASDIQTEYAKANRHPVENADSHADTEDGAGVGVPNRHAECSDCHDPHEAKAGTRAAGSNDAGPPIAGAYGVAVVNGAAGTEPTYVPAQIAKEYELCFKCHSGYTTQPAGQGNKGVEFNTNNSSFHPVEGTGHNPSGNLMNQLVPNGLATNSLISCTDCHNNDVTGDSLATDSGPVANSPDGPKGLHGSTNERIMRAGYWTIADGLVGPSSYDAANFQLCYLCHDKTKLVEAETWALGASTNFYDDIGGLGNLHWVHLMRDPSATCVNCHYNIHSNEQPPNTQYRVVRSGGATVYGSGPPPTTEIQTSRLISFSPDLLPIGGRARPEWEYFIDAASGSEAKERHCYMNCHGAIMNAGHMYKPKNGGDVP